MSKIKAIIWKISPVPTQRQVKEIRGLPNVRKVTRDGAYSLVHHTATEECGRDALLRHSLGDLGFEVVGHSPKGGPYAKGMALAKRWKKG